MVKRLRIFAGPNGSGKSTFIKNFPSAPNLKLAMNVNADDLAAASVLIAEVEQGKNVHVIDPDEVPNWFIKYLAEKINDILIIIYTFIFLILNTTTNYEFHRFNR